MARDHQRNEQGGSTNEAVFAVRLAKLASGSSDSLIEAFEISAEVDGDGVEFWRGRRLHVLLGYKEWRNFLLVVDKAKVACTTAGQAVPDHFVEVNKMVELGSGATREVDDLMLTRYACYLIAQNGDSKKKPVAFAQTYFAIQARRQELLDQDEARGVSMPEDQKRLLLRDEIKAHNRNLASAAKGAGVVNPLDFAIFQTFGYKGLYGGLDRQGIQRAKGLKTTQNILDHMGSTELAANLFRATQTEDKLKRDRIKGKDSANQTHFEVGRKVRRTIAEIGGAMPEQLPTAEDINKIERRLKAIDPGGGTSKLE